EDVKHRDDEFTEPRIQARILELQTGDPAHLPTSRRLMAPDWRMVARRLTRLDVSRHGAKLPLSHDHSRSKASTRCGVRRTGATYWTDEPEPAATSPGGARAVRRPARPGAAASLARPGRRHSLLGTPWRRTRARGVAHRRRAPGAARGDRTA